MDNAVKSPSSPTSTFSTHRLINNVRSVQLLQISQLIDWPLKMALPLRVAFFQQKKRKKPLAGVPMCPT